MARILIIEDDGALRADISDTLDDWGHDVEQASDGLEGLELVKTWQPDLILCDVNMPRCSGMLLVEHLTGFGSPWAGISFFFMSSCAERAQLLEGIASGAEDYIIKPIDFDVLKAKIETNLKKKDALLKRQEINNLAISLKDVALHGVVLSGTLGVLLVSIIFAVYWVKTALGIDVFSNFHFFDIFL